mmetsp:Transcript_22733/g.33571  ORF Transcript_22733/g.33571 Transcript_22733/m.33571 type:complete len:203 (+) Transcript_22733:1329-1937(+)
MPFHCSIRFFIPPVVVKANHYGTIPSLLSIHYKVIVYGANAITVVHHVVTGQMIMPLAHGHFRPWTMAWSVKNIGPLSTQRMICPGPSCIILVPPNERGSRMLVPYCAVPMGTFLLLLERHMNAFVKPSKSVIWNCGNCLVPQKNNRICGVVNRLRGVKQIHHRWNVLGMSVSRRGENVNGRSSNRSRRRRGRMYWNDKVKK